MFVRGSQGSREGLLGGRARGSSGAYQGVVQRAPQGSDFRLCVAMVSRMTLILSHSSALQYLRLVDEGLVHARPVIAQPGRLACEKQVPDVVPGTHAQKLRSLTRPLHTLNNSRNHYPSTTDCVFRAWRALPDGSLLDVGDGLVVAAPELIFAQMASKLSSIELICLGFELCGIYPNAANARKGVVGRTPLTTPAKLAKFVAACANEPGVRAARAALPYIESMSASPMETAAFLRLSLPYRLGGRNFPKPLINYRIGLGARDRKVSSKNFYLCDLYWPERRLAVEYDSDLHADARKIAQDASRRNALLHKGIEVVTITKGQMYDFDEFERTAEVIRRKLKVDFSPRCRDYSARRAKLIKTVLAGRVCAVGEDWLREPWL